MALKDKKLKKRYAQNYITTIPDAFHKSLKSSVLYQIFRFVIINIKMMIVVRKSH
jgi:hypothetical protein